MKKKIFLTAVLLITALLSPLCFTACAGGSTPNEGETHVITDHRGIEVTLPKKVERIAVCDIYPVPSVLSVFFDSADKIVGIAPASRTAAENGLLSTLYPEILDADYGFFDGSNLNVESLMAIEPDVVFYSSENTAIGDQLRNAGFPAVAVSAGNWGYDAIETLKQWILLFSEIFPEKQVRAQLVADYSEKIYQDVQKRVSVLSEEEREDVFFLFQYSEGAITTSGAHFFGQWWADAICARNVGAELDTQNATTVNMEQIYAWNPSKIFITNFNRAQPEDLYQNTIGVHDWSGVDAVVNKQVYKMPLGMYRSYTCGVDTPITLYWLAKAAYPELFRDIDITEETKAYYKLVFGITLTDEQAEQIFAPVSAGSAF